MTVLEASGHIKAGKLRALAVTGASASPRCPRCRRWPKPALPGFNSISWIGMLAPAGTPKEIVDKVSSDVREVLASDEVKPEADRARRGPRRHHSGPVPGADQFRSKALRAGDQGQEDHGRLRRYPVQHFIREHHEREQAASSLEFGRRRRQRLARDPEQLLGRDDGPAGLGFADGRPAARRRRLPGDGDDAAGDLDHRDRSGRSRSVARARHPDEGARRRRLRRHLPDGELARRRPEPGRLDALRAARHAQLRPGARDAVRRRRLPAARQRRRSSRWR